VSYEPIRPFTDQQLKIARGIDRELSYREIAAEMGISEHTVRQYVREMALLLDEPRELPPRWRILIWVRQSKWHDAHRLAMRRQAR
jgi:DNA-binding NarL/FixJ family response regulator